MVLCGISAPFGALSPCGGQVAHALLTRPPLELIDSIRRLPQQVPARLACVRHAASVRPEPGSNSYVQSVIALDLWKNSSLSESVLLKHDSLKILDCSCVLSLFCIVFKVRCSQASLYIISHPRFSVNTFFEVFLLFLHLFSKPLSFNGFRHLLLHFFLLTLSPFSYLSFPCLSFSSCSLSPFPFYSAHSVTLPFVIAVSTLFHRVLIFYCISLSALLQYLSEAYTASKHCSQ